MDTGADGSSSSSERRFKSKLKAMKSGSISSVWMLVKLFELQTMSEGRKVKVMLPDGRKFDLQIQPKLFASELLDLASSHFNLKEKEYFGLSFKDSSSHSHWLQLERRVLDHSFPKTHGPLVIYLNVRFYVENIFYLKDDTTLELFFLQVKQGIYEGKIDCDSDNVFMLAAYVLQATYGDFVDEVSAKGNLKNLAVLPTETLKEFPSISYCEKRVLTIYRNLRGHTRGSSLVSYMSIVERLPMYGVHYYEVKDRSGLPWWLGVSYKGISLYDFNDKNVPRRVFTWNQLENLYFHDRKFSVEVHDAKRASSVARRTFGLSNVNILAWTSETALLTKTIWTMAIAQHQFFLDSKKSKPASVRTKQEVGVDSSVGESEGKERSRRAFRGHHARSLSASIAMSQASFGSLVSIKVAERELQEALKARKAALEEELQEKTKSLAEICLQEAAVTGQLPSDVPSHLMDLKAASSLPAAAASIKKPPAAEDVEVTLGKLEKDFKMQERITSAYQNLVSNMMIDQRPWKIRQQLHSKALKKLKEVETKLRRCRQLAGKPQLHYESELKAPKRCSVESVPKTQVAPTSCSSPDLMATITSDRTALCLPSRTVPLGTASKNSQGPSTCAKSNRRDVASNRQAFPLNSLSCCPVVDSINDMVLYNIRTHQMTNYDSTDDLDMFLLTSDISHNRRASCQWPSKHGSLEGAYKRGSHLPGKGANLDRNLSSGCLECRELYSDSGIFPDHTSLSSIIDMTCEDDVDRDAFQSSAMINHHVDCFRNPSLAQIPREPVVCCFDVSKEQRGCSSDRRQCCSCTTRKCSNYSVCVSRQHSRYSSHNSSSQNCLLSQTTETECKSSTYKDGQSHCRQKEDLTSLQSDKVLALHPKNFVNIDPTVICQCGDHLSRQNSRGKTSRNRTCYCLSSKSTDRRTVLADGPLESGQLC